MTTRRNILMQPLAWTAGLSIAPSLWANTPAAIRFIVPGSAGTGADTVARFMSRAMEGPLGTTIIVDNRPGAGGVIGTDAVAKAPPDGNTVLVFSANHYLLPLVYDKVPYDAVKDFGPVAGFGSSVLVLVTAPNAPYATLKDLIAAGRREGTGLTYSSAGNGTASHLCGALLNSLAGTRFTHVPYKSASQGLLDVSSGAVTLGFLGAAGALPLIRSGRLKLLAVTSAARSAHFPQTPTMAEAGVPGFEVTSPLFALVPAGTPAPVVQRLSRAFTDAAGTPAFKEFCTVNGLEPDVWPAAEFAATMPKDFEKWKRMVDLVAASMERPAAVTPGEAARR